MKKYKLYFVLSLGVACLLICGAARQSEHADDVVSNYSFRVEIDGMDAGYFTSVTGFSIEQEVIEYQDGDNPLTKKRPGRVKYGNITFGKAYCDNSVLNDWIEAARLRNGEYAYKNISIILTDNNTTINNEIRRWNCFGCFPISWKLTPLNNHPGNDVIYEEMVIATEWFEEVSLF